MMAAGVVLQLVKAVVGDVAVIDPCHAAADLLGAGVDFRICTWCKAVDPTNRAPVSITPLSGNASLFIEAQVGQRLPRPGAELLAPLGRVDLGKPDFHLLVSGTKRRDGVAVGYADHRAEQLLSERRPCSECAQSRNKQPADY